MAKRKRNTNDDPDDERSTPRRSTRLAHLAANTVSTEGSSKTMPSSNNNDSHGRLDSGSDGSSGEKSLSDEALVQEVLKMTRNKDKAELMILELMTEYSFSFPHFKKLLKHMVNLPYLFNLHSTNCRYRK